MADGAIEPGDQAHWVPKRGPRHGRQRNTGEVRCNFPPIPLGNHGGLPLPYSLVRQAWYP